MVATQTSIKSRVADIVGQLAEDATWDDVLYELSLSRAIDEGIEDANAGRTISTDELRKDLGLLP